MAGPPADLLAVLSRRESLLRSLTDSPRSKRELVESLDVSRSTVDRAIRELQSEGVVERRDGGYALTLPGRILLEQYREFEQVVAGVDEAGELLSVLPADAELPPEMLADLEVTKSERTTPYRPVERFFELVEDAEAIRILSTAIGPQFVDAIHEQITEEGMAYTVAATESIVERLVSEYTRQLSEALATGHMELRELAADPPFTVAVLELPTATYAGVILYGSEGARGFLCNDAADAVAWANAYIDRHMERATPITSPRA